LCNSSAVEAQHALSAYDLHNLWHVRGMKQCFGMGHLGHIGHDIDVHTELASTLTLARTSHGLCLKFELD